MQEGVDIAMKAAQTRAIEMIEEQRTGRQENLVRVYDQMEVQQIDMPNQLAKDQQHLEESNLQTERFLFDHSNEPNHDPSIFSAFVQLKNIKKQPSDTLPQHSINQVSPSALDDDGKTPDLPGMSPSLTKFISHDFSKASMTQSTSNQEDILHIQAKGLPPRSGSIPTQKVMPLIPAVITKKQGSIKVEPSHMRSIEEEQQNEDEPL